MVPVFVVAAFASWMAFQTVYGVAGIEISRTPYSRSASTMPLIIHGRCRRGAAFPARLDAERIGGREHFRDLGDERRQRVGARHAVVHQRAAQRLPGLGIDVTVLPHRLTNALRDAAVGLPVHDQRVDAASDVIDPGIARDLNRAGLRIDLDLAYGTAVRKHRIVHLVVGGDCEAIFELGGRACGGLLREFKEIERAVVSRAPNGRRQTRSCSPSPNTTAATSCPGDQSAAALENTVAACRIDGRNASRRRR